MTGFSERLGVATALSLGFRSCENMQCSTVSSILKVLLTFQAALLLASGEFDEPGIII